MALSLLSFFFLYFFLPFLNSMKAVRVFLTLQARKTNDLGQGNYFHPSKSSTCKNFKLSSWNFLSPSIPSELALA
ncbi:hypothetical protein ACB092_06G123800 [Castanea dentata]